jgi:hypothetical protein
MPSHCSFKPNLHELWLKKRARVELGIWFLTKTPLKARSNEVWLEHAIHHWKDIFKGYKILPSHSWKRIDLRNIWTSKILGLPFGNLEKKWHLDVVFVGRHKIYYREGSGASSQRLRAMWSLCLRLSLLSSPHHFHSTCTNHLFFLIMQVDIIFFLWICTSPILELQHAFLPSKCCKLKNVPQFLFFSVVSL